MDNNNKPKDDLKVEIISVERSEEKKAEYSQMERRASAERQRRNSEGRGTRPSGASEARKRTSSKRKKKKGYDSTKQRVLVYTGRFFATLGVTLGLLLVFLYILMFMVVNGPSKSADVLFVQSVRESSAMGFLANIYHSQAEIDEIEANNTVKDTDEVTNPDLVVIPPEDNNKDDEGEETPDIQVIDVSGATFNGKMMIVKDPSRLFVGTVPVFTQGRGQVVADIAERYDAIAGINGGEFVDLGSTSYTAQPVGLVMIDGEIKNGDLYSTYHVTGITYDNKLVVGNMSGSQAKELNIRDCVSINNNIGPFLIVNGEPTEISGTGGGLNPRTAIGQRADGAILLLVIDGRQANTLGASFADCMHIMQEYGAVNASCMDGGTSTQMYYDGEVINNPYSPTGPRRCPTAFLIKK